MARRRSLVVVFPVLFLVLQGLAPLQGFAQSREVALTMADTVTPNFNEQVLCSSTSPCTFPVGTSTAFAIGGSYAERFKTFRRFSLYGEIPVLHVAARDFSNLSLPSYSTWFITPGVQMKWRWDRFYTPFASAGLGIARFSSTNPYDNTGHLTTKTTSLNNLTGAVRVGGGVDIRTFIPQLSIRGEAYDIASGRPEAIRKFINVKVAGSKQHDLLIGGSIVFAF